jgi:hypothetical protein
VNQGKTHQSGNAKTVAPPPPIQKKRRQKQHTNRRRQRETLTGRKNENDQNRRRRKPAPIWTRGAEANLFLIAPPPPCCLHCEKSFGFEREAADLVLFLREVRELVLERGFCLVF